MQDNLEVAQWFNKYWEKERFMQTHESLNTEIKEDMEKNTICYNNTQMIDKSSKIYSTDKDYINRYCESSHDKVVFNNEEVQLNGKQIDDRGIIDDYNYLKNSIYQTRRSIETSNNDVIINNGNNFNRENIDHKIENRNYGAENGIMATNDRNFANIDSIMMKTYYN